MRNTRAGGNASTIILSALLVLALLGWLRLVGQAETDKAAIPPPNIVLIMADDLGWMDTGVSGGGYLTPQIDRIAAQGLRLQQAYAASPLCSPTRASVLTGMHPARLQMTAAHAHEEVERFSAQWPTRVAPGQPFVTPYSATRLDPELPNLASVFVAAGYRTALFGKWHLGAGDYLPARYGFEQVEPNNFEPLPRGYLSPWGTAGLPSGRPEGEHVDVYLAQQAAEFIAASNDQPYLLAFWPYSVHWPYQAARDRIRHFEQDYDGVGVRQNPVMAAMLESLDISVGVVLDAIAASANADNTLVVFMSDNGGVDWMSAGRYAAMATDNAPLRGGKAQVFEGGLRIPLYLSWPGKIEPGVVSQKLISSEDLFPTLLDAAGIDRSALRTDGRSFLAELIAAEPDAGSERDRVLAHLPHYVERLQQAPVTALRQGPWKLIRQYGSLTDQQIVERLYHLQRDPGELKDVSGEFMQQRERMSEAMDAQLLDYGAAIPRPNADFVPACVAPVLPADSAGDNPACAVGSAADARQDSATSVAHQTQDLPPR